MSVSRRNIYYRVYYLLLIIVVLSQDMQRQIVTLKDFNMLSLIGIGNYAKVVLVRKKATGHIYAMKIVKKRKEPQGQIKGINKMHAYIEKQILNQCLHPFIVRLYSTFQRQRKLYYILEYCPGGQLFGIIRRMKRLSEETAKFYASQIVLALQHLHQKGYIYRDLKPENVLIDKKGYIKLIDFGLSCRIQETSKADLIAGTPQYLSPEIFEKGFNIGTYTDWWAFGNLLFEMVAGFPPFFVQNTKFQIIKNKICSEQPPLYFISNPTFKDLLSRLLHKDPMLRLGTGGTAEIKSHGWFEGIDWEALCLQQFATPFTPIIKSDSDTRWFQMDQNELTPPQEDSDLNSGEKYQQFSSSWKSSPQDLQLSSQHKASPTQITMDIEQINK